MDSFLTAQQEIRDAILKVCDRFGDDYWLARRRWVSAGPEWAASPDEIAIDRP